MPMTVRRISLATRKRLFTAKTKQNIQHYHNNDTASGISDIPLNKFENRFYNMLDTINPFLYRHPKLGNVIMYIGEKLILVSKKF